MSCCGDCERDAARDAVDDALRADAHARRLQDKTVWSKRMARAPVFARDMIAAAHALEVAGDAWEEAGLPDAAAERRERAHQNYVKAFWATHSRLHSRFPLNHLYYFMISDVEAGKLARAAGVPLPQTVETFRYVRPLSPWGAPMELHRLALRPSEQVWAGRKRGWTYALAGVR